MTAQQFDVLIVGAGHAGAQAAAFLRQQKFQGSIGLVSDEPHLPYERPPLSKEYLSSEKTFDKLLLRPATFWTERNIALLLGERVCEVDPKAHCVHTESGMQIRYERLIWAAGGAPRRLQIPGADLSGVHVLRQRDDVDAMQRDLPSTKHVVVIGAGYIGLEASASFVSRGIDTTIVECADRVLNRVAGETVATFYEAEHRHHGVHIELRAQAAAFLGDTGRVKAVRLTDGRTLPADLVLVGIGIVPSTEPLHRAGASGANGVDVDAFCRTSIASIYAIGDCAAHVNRYAGNRRVRVESVQNATDMAMVVAKHIMGCADPYAAVPWFWSNQFDLKLQTLGLSAGHDRIVVRGDPATRKFSVLYLKNDRLLAIDCINCTRDFVQAKTKLFAPTTANLRALSDIDLPLKSLFGSEASSIEKATIHDVVR